MTEKFLCVQCAPEHHFSAIFTGRTQQRVGETYWQMQSMNIPVACFCLNWFQSPKNKWLGNIRRQMRSLFFSLQNLELVFFPPTIFFKLGQRYLIEVSTTSKSHTSLARNCHTCIDFWGENTFLQCLLFLKSYRVDNLWVQLFPHHAGF